MALPDSLPAPLKRFLVKVPPRRLLLGAIDALLIATSLVLAYLLRFDFSIPDTVDANYAQQLKAFLPWVVVGQVVLFALFGLYRGMLRYASVNELLQILGASMAGVAVLYVANEILELFTVMGNFPVMGYEKAQHVMRMPRTIPVIFWLLMVVSVSGFRFSRRLWLVTGQRFERDATRILVAGAGDLGDSVVRTMLSDPSSGLRPVALVTRHSKKVGMRLQGIPVAGELKDIAKVLAREQIGEVVVALDGASPEELRTIVSQCESASAKVNIAPSLTEVMSGRVSVSALRPIEIEDLLAREPVRLEIPPDKNYLKGERVMVTGAGGSIGAELCRQILIYGPETLVLLGKGENSIYEINDELRSRAPLTRLSLVIADVRDPDKMSRVFQEHRPTLVFHAAAHKHVPLMELVPDEAVKNNIVGTAVVAHLAHLHNTKRFILVSTDKAVRPTSVMGASKRLAEQAVFSLARESKTIFCAVRFGNVLGSRGSVIPLFKRQIERGGPVTVTHPEVTRFFMTVHEAVALILQAGAIGKGGQLFVLDMGEPIRIVDLARNLIVLSGLRPDVDVRVEIVGLRPGEKVKEELLTQGEGVTRTELGKVFTAQPDSAPPWKEMIQRIQALADVAGRGDPELIRSVLAFYVPEYRPEGIVPRSLEEALAALESADVQPKDTPVALQEAPEKESEPETATGEPRGTAETDEEISSAPPETAQEEAEKETEEPEEETRAESPAAPPGPSGPSGPYRPPEPVPSTEEQDEDKTPELFADTEAETEEGERGETGEEREDSRSVDPQAPSPSPKPAAERSDRTQPTVAPVEPRPATPRAKPEQGSLWDLDEDEQPPPPPAARKEEDDSEAEPSESVSERGRNGGSMRDDLLDEGEGGLEAPPKEEAGASEPEPARKSNTTAPPEAGEEEESASPKPSREAILTTPDRPTTPSVRLEPRVAEFHVLYPIYSSDQPVDSVVRACQEQIAGGFLLELLDCTPEGMSLESAQAATRDDARIRFDRTEFFNPAQMINRAIEAHREARYLIALPPCVTLLPECLAELELAFRRDEDLACVFSDFNLLTARGEYQKIELLDWTPGVVHERHEFGYLQAYRIQALRDLDGLREDLRYAADYDLMLRLTDDWTYQRVRKALAVVAEVDLLSPVDAALPDPDRLRFPGEPLFGGYSYLFYPAEIEEEVSSVFEQMLHRRGFWIDPKLEPVPTVPGLATDMDVSLVIPVQNGERFIANSIQKVLHGTFQAFEILVADAGSGDRTREVVQRFMARDRRVRLIVDESGSRLGAINQALRQARGRYIGHLEWDDELAPTALEKMVAYVKAHPTCAMAVSHYEIIDEEGNPVRDVPPVTHAAYSPNQLLRHDGVGALRVVPRGVLKHLGYYQARNYSEGGEDYDLALKVSEMFEIGRVPEVLYRRRQWNGRRTTSVAREKNLDYARLEAIRRRREMNRLRTPRPRE